MISITMKEKCSGCTACYSSCPVKCISMVSDEEGFLYPKVQEKKCINCGLCEIVCPVLNNKNESKKEQRGYLVQIKDEQIRKESTAGGAFSAIALYILNKGGVVFGAAYDEKFQVRHICVDNKSELYKLRNSKYVQSIVGDSFHKVKEYLEFGRYVCFSGTPCQIEGLRSYLKNEYENLILVDVVCHGIPSPLVWNRYLEYQNINADTYDNIMFRDKYYGYKYSTMSIISGDRNVYHAGSQKDPMLRAYFADICDRPICYSCPFKKRYRNSDITLWDCFSVYEFDKKMDDDKGTTRVLCHSDKGNQILNSINEYVRKTEVDSNHLVKGVKEMFESVEQNPNRYLFMLDAKRLTARELFGKYYPIGHKVKVKTLLRFVLLKTGLYSFAKKINNKATGR